MGRRTSRINLNSWLTFCGEESIEDSDLDSEIRFFTPFEDPGDPTPEEQATEKEIEVKSSTRLDVLAKKLYGDELLWWVLAWRNNLDLPDADLSPGMILVVPSANYVRNTLLG